MKNNTYFGFTKEEIIMLYEKAIKLNRKFVSPNIDDTKTNLEKKVDSIKDKVLKRTI